MFLKIIFLFTVVWAEVIQKRPLIENELTVFNYHYRIGIPEAARMKELEEREIEYEDQNNTDFRIVGGSSVLFTRSYPYQAGLVVKFTKKGIHSICGASLLSNTRLVTAAHCWYDGLMQAHELEVVLGSKKLFSGGFRVKTKNVTVHQDYDPATISDDIAIITIPWVNYTRSIKSIALPSGKAAHESFAGQWAWATGFGITSDDQSANSISYLNQVWLKVINNDECAEVYAIIQDGIICTKGTGGVGTCRGDSGGPLALKWNDEKILVGITSFGAHHCEKGLPSAFTRVTSYLSWIKQRL